MSLSAKQAQHIFHSKDPLALLYKYGYTSQESDEILWQLFMDEDTPEATPFMARRLFETFHDVDARRQAEFIGQGLQNHQSTHLGYLEKRVLWDVRLSEVSRCVGHFCKREPEVVYELLPHIPEEYWLYVLCLSVKKRKLEHLPELYLPLVLEQWFFSSVTIKELILKTKVSLDILRGMFLADAWTKACIDLLVENELRESTVFPWDSIEGVSLAELVDIGRMQCFSFQGLTELFVGHGEEAIGLIEAALFPAIDAIALECHEDGWPGYAMIPAYRVLMEETKKPIPAELEPWLWRLLAEGKVDDCRKWMLMLEAERAADLLVATFRFSSFSITHFDLIDSPTLPARMLALICARDGDKPGYFLIERGERMRRITIDDDAKFDRYLPGVVSCGSRIVAPIEATLKEDYSNKTTLFLLEALRQINTKESILAMRPLLLHKSTVVRGLVSKTFSAFEGLEVDVVKDALLSTKKPIRTTGLALLHSFPDTPARLAVVEEVLRETKHKDVKGALEPLCEQSVADDDGPHEPPEDEKQRLEEQSLFEQAKALVDHLSTSEKVNLRYQRGSYVDSGPVSVAFWGGRAHTRMIDAVCHYADEPLASWCFVYERSCGDKLEHLGEADLERLSYFGEKVYRPLEMIAPLSRENTRPMLEWLGEIGGVDVVPSLVSFLMSSKKKLQEGAELGLMRVGKDATPVLVSLLKDRKKRVRAAVGRILLDIGDSTAIPALEEVLAKEKDGELRSLFQEAIACSGGDDLCQGFASSVVSVEKLEAELRKVEVNPSLTNELMARFPPVLWHDGQELSEEAMRCWVSLLMGEKERWTRPSIRLFRKQMDLDSLDSFHCVLEQWFIRGFGLEYAKYLACSEDGLFGVVLTLLCQSGLKLRLPQRLIRHNSRFSGLLLHTVKEWLRVDEEHESLLDWGRENLLAEFVPSEKSRQDFLEEVADLRSIPKREPGFAREFGGCFDGEGVNKDDASHWQLVHTDFPALGELASRLDILLFGFPENVTFPDSEVHVYVLRKRKRQLEQKLQTELRLSSERLQSRESRQWTSGGWKQLFWGRGVWRLLTAAMVFANAEGQLFMCLPSGVCVDVDGHVIPTPRDSFVNVCDVSTLSQEQRAAWSLRHAEIAKAWEERKLYDLMEDCQNEPLSDIRNFLAQPPSKDGWKNIETLIFALPDNDEFKALITYTDTHLQEKWKDLRRRNHHIWGERFLSSLLSPGTTLVEGEPSPLSYLPLFNELAISWSAIEEKHIEKLLEMDLKRIWSLVVSGSIKDEVLSMMSTHLVFPSLRRLHLSLRPSSPFELHAPSTSFEMLANVKAFQKVTDLQATPLTLSGLLDVGGSLLSGLESLGFVAPGLLMDCLPAVNELEEMASIRCLSFECGKDLDDALVYLSEYSQFSSLETLELSVNSYIGHEAAEALARSECFPHLRRLRLRAHMDRRFSRFLRCVLASKTLPGEVLVSLEARYRDFLSTMS